MIRHINKLISLFLTFSFILFFSCSEDENDILGGGKNDAKSIYVNTESGIARFAVKSNGEWSISSDKNSSKWASLDVTTGNGDAEVTVSYKENNSFARMGTFIIKLAKEAVADTIYLKQYGTKAILEFINTETSIPSLGKSAVFDINTNLPASYRSRVSLDAIDEKGEAISWIEDLAITDDMRSVSFKVAPNQGEEARKARIRLGFTNGWSDEQYSYLFVSQGVAGGTADTRVVSFDELRSLVQAPAGSVKIKDNISLEGIVISDAGNPNVAENPMLTNTTIDYNVNDKTAYLQSQDGRYGVAVLADSKEDNLMHRYDRVALWLKDVVLEKKENPERYLITGITQKNYIRVEKGDASGVAAKERYISQLTDEDLYTFVTLKSCELPVRKGSFTPINEGYGVVYSASKVDKYPLLMRDIQGNQIFLMTNIGCTYRRDGNSLPKGSGDISGVLVHETYSRFEKDGNIGKYQLRHLTREDIAIPMDENQSFSQIIAQWDKFNRQNNVMMATGGNGKISHTSAGYQGTGYASMDFSMLGPITGNSSEDNKGVNSSSQNLTFANSFWWNDSKNTGESWVIEFSTKGITTDQLSLQLATFNNAIGAPRYWTVEWSAHGEPAQAWTKVADYTVPDIVSWDNTLLNQLSGWKNMNFGLPLEMLNHEKVYLRLRVSANKAGTATTYDSGVIKSAANTLSYVSIRYNK
ncbi:MAG: DUF5689 domain-containing protein [Bacteroidales bacterium]